MTRVTHPEQVIYGLWCLCHPEDGIRYVGQTKNGADWRFTKHVQAAFRNNDAEYGTPKSRWIRKHGRENIGFSVLEVCLDSDEMNTREVFWIEVLRTSVGPGLNVLLGGQLNRSGYVHSEDVKSIIRDSKHKISETVAAEIKRRLWCGEPVRSVAKSLDLSDSYVSRINRGVTWGHILWPVGPREQSKSSGLRSQSRMAYLKSEGSVVPARKLTADQVRCILGRLEMGESLAAIAKDYGVTASNISMIKTGKTWSHLH